MNQRSSWQSFRDQLPLAMANLRTLYEAGVPIAFGTDGGAVARFQGYFEHMEMELMVAGNLVDGARFVR